MNALVAQLILERIEAADLPWVDKTAALTRAISYKPPGSKVGPRILPIACTVNDPYSCDPGTVDELLPGDKYASVLFIEGDSMPAKRQGKPGIERVVGPTYLSRLRIVVWLNCAKLGGACDCGGQAALNLISALTVPKYKSGDLLDLKHEVVGGGPVRGREIFGKYTFNEDRSQYLHYPYDFFALDVQTEFRLAPGCEAKLQLGNVQCWTAPTPPRRRYADEFTCEELTGDHGLTEAQIDCVTPDCEPFGISMRNTEGTLLITGVILDPCGKESNATAPDATITINGVTAMDAPSGTVKNIVVTQGGVPVGSWNPVAQEWQIP